MDQYLKSLSRRTHIQVKTKQDDAYALSSKYEILNWHSIKSREIP
jgi:hypothetical protein